MENTAKSRKLIIGEYEVCPIPTGVFGLDGGAMFGTVPKVLWSRSNPADRNNQIPMEARALLLKGKNRNILIDCGNGEDFVFKYGEKLGGKFAEMYKIDTSGPSLLRSLEKFGVKPEDVTEVILTHLHFDHAGGGTCVRDHRLVPTFAKAKYYLQAANLETASKPNLRERSSYFPANFQPLADAGVLRVLDGEQENLLPGISLIVSDGHTLGQQVVKISDGKQTLLYCADLVPTSSHVRLAWIMGYDLNSLKIIEEKQKVLSQAADEGWYLFFEHDPYCDAATIERKGSDFSVKERFCL